jgi:hypothetical protein
MYPFPNLPPALSREIFAALCRSLPQPVDDTQQARDARDTMAMAAVAALDPDDTAEAMLAVQVVVAEAHARDCLRLATEHRDDLPTACRCRAQAASMMRQMHQALRVLRQTQALRPIVPAEHLPEANSPRPPAPPPPPPARHGPNLYPFPPISGRDVASSRHDAARLGAGVWPPAASDDPDPASIPAGLPRFAWAWVKPGRHIRPINGDISHETKY